MFFGICSIYLTNRMAAFAIIDKWDRWVELGFHTSLVHAWFVFQTLMGWLLITIVAVSLDRRFSTIAATGFD